MAAETVDPKLRAEIRAARDKGIRCFKAIVVGRPGAGGESGGRTLALAFDSKEVPNAPMNKEFERCAGDLVDDKSPCLLLFRADEVENIDGSRWVLVTWLPDAAAEADRAIYVRSRGILARLAPQPYYLHEFFAKKREDLTWKNAREATGTAPAKPSKHQNKDDQFKLAADVRASLAITASSPKGPVVLKDTVAGFLEKFVRKEEACLRLILSGSLKVQAGQHVSGASTLEAKPMDARSPSQLSKGGLPSSACFFIMYNRDDLLFIHWCPESTKDAHKIMEDARYAVLKSVVLGHVLKAIPEPLPRVLQVDAREPTDIADGAAKVTELGTFSSVLTAARPTGSKDPDRGWPAQGAVADWPDHWPSAATTATFPATLSFPERPVPSWRGGRKGGTISASGAGAAMTAASGHGHHAHGRSKITRLTTQHFKDSQG